MLALAVLLYVLLDGFDLGVGMVFPFAPGEEGRRGLLHAISPVWDANETWVVVPAAALFGTFPTVFSVLFSAFYVPLFLLLIGFILRGMAFGYRYKAIRTRLLLDGRSSAILSHYERRRRRQPH